MTYVESIVSDMFWFGRRIKELVTCEELVVSLDGEGFEIWG